MLILSTFAQSLFNSYKTTIIVTSKDQQRRRQQRQEVFNMNPQAFLNAVVNRATAQFYAAAVAQIQEVA
jgi:hypothetical protein